jgi:hypothetical protein
LILAFIPNPSVLLDTVPKWLLRLLGEQIECSGMMVYGGL